MNTQRLTLITVPIAVLALAALLFGPRLLQRPAGSSLDLTDQPALGSADALVTIALFEDFRCPHCATFSEEVLPRLQRNFLEDGRVRIVYLNFPVVDPVSASERVAEIGECVYRQNEQAFWELEPVLFRSQRELDSEPRVLELITTYAPDVDIDAVEACVRAGDGRREVERDVAMARELNLTGTPSVLVNGELVSNPTYEAVRRAVERALTDEG